MGSHYRIYVCPECGNPGEQNYGGGVCWHEDCERTPKLVPVEVVPRLNAEGQPSCPHVLCTRQQQTVPRKALDATQHTLDLMTDELLAVKSLADELAGAIQEIAECGPLNPVDTVAVARAALTRYREATVTRIAVDPDNPANEVEL
jgi:hypothetical protein